MNKILALWAVPRSTSTAFEWMMRQRGDLNCFHEPYGEAWYQGEEPLWPRLTEDSVRTPGLTLGSVHAKLLKAADSAPVFIKDFPHYVSHLWDDAFLDNFNHSFLIRDPAEVAASFAATTGNVTANDIGTARQTEIFEQARELTGRDWPVIEGRDVLADPERMLPAICREIDIPFMGRYVGALGLVTEVA